MKHWTARSLDDLVYRLAFDFLSQIEVKMELDQISRAELAKRLSVSEGRISQILNHRRNLTIKAAAKLAHAVGMKASFLAYDDGDQRNENGPVNAGIFVACWQRSKRPKHYPQGR